MTELPRRVALIVSLLLTSVGTASAQCAWVLWEEVERLFLDTPRRESKDWKLHVARQTQLQCEEVLTRMWDVTLKQNTRMRTDQASRKSTPHQASSVSPTTSTRAGRSRPAIAKRPAWSGSSSSQCGNL
jgi:hypothetical protein